MNPTTLLAASTRAMNAAAHTTMHRPYPAREDALDAFRLLGEALGLDPESVAGAMLTSAKLPDIEEVRS